MASTVNRSRKLPGLRQLCLDLIAQISTPDGLLYQVHRSPPEVAQAVHQQVDAMDDQMERLIATVAIVLEGMDQGRRG